ncbi:MAG: hypothetical protein LBH32_09815 [Dysgonamonadaceae bacterium]|jgi:hypothetical protein|nr:hypothetical protein [Dysgonamonadaceae bacterium]
MNKKVPFKNKYDTAKKYDKISTCLLYISTALLICNFILSKTAIPISVIRWIEIINCLAIVLFSIVEFVVDYIHFGAETHRREDLVDNSFACLLAENRTESYYTNDDLKAGLYKMGVNNFESCFFSYNIAKADLTCLWLKSIILSLLFIFVGIVGYNEILIFIVQLSIPAVLLQQSIKHTIFVSRLKNVLERYRTLFSNLKSNKNKKNDSEIIRDILEYEATISWGNTLLDESTYNKMNASLSNEWEDLKKEYSIR